MVHRIEELFFENPVRNFQIREMARITGISKTAVSYQINKLIKEGLVLKEKKGVFPSFRAEETSEIYRFYKKQRAAEEILASGLLDYLEEKSQPRCLILFGSFAKGEHDSRSDIDIFAQAKETTLQLEKFEKKLKHKINVFFEADLSKLSTELLNNMVNGIKLRGFLKVK